MAHGCAHHMFLYEDWLLQKFAEFLGKLNLRKFRNASSELKSVQNFGSEGDFRDMSTRAEVVEILQCAGSVRDLCRSACVRDCLLACLIACWLACTVPAAYARTRAGWFACLLAWTTSAVRPEGFLAFVPSSQV